jgi:hypothetical protein
MIKDGYLQHNADHIIFIRRKREKFCVLIVYVDDIVLISNDSVEWRELKAVSSSSLR